MSEAEKTLKELGFIKQNKREHNFYYGQNKEIELCFYEDTLKWEYFLYNPGPVNREDLDANNYNMLTSVELTLAIVEYMKELGWFD